MSGFPLVKSVISPDSLGPTILLYDLPIELDAKPIRSELTISTDLLLNHLLDNEKASALSMKGNTSILHLFNKNRDYSTHTDHCIGNHVSRMLDAQDHHGMGPPKCWQYTPTR